MAARLESDSMLEGGIDKMKTCTALHFCSAQPDIYADIATYSLGSVVIDSGDFSVANGDVSGRKCTIAQQTGITPTSDGIVSCIIAGDGTDWTGWTTSNTNVYTSIPVTINPCTKEVRDVATV